MDKTERIYIRLDKETKDDFFKLCEDKHINKSDLIRGWIKDYIEKEGK